MTRPLIEVESVLALRHDGLGARRIARRTGIPVRTVQTWLEDPSRAVQRARQRASGCLGSCRPLEEDKKRTYSYLLGMYLGDGHMVRARRVYRFSIYCDQKYPRIIEEVADAITGLLPIRVSHIQREGCIAVSAYSSHWPCLFPQHGKGMKHERSIVLEPWQVAIAQRYPRPFVRGLIQSDGWRGENVAIKHTELAIEYRTYTRYQFTNRSDDIRGLFCWALDLIDVRWTQSNAWTISVSRRKDVHYLDSFIGPKR